MPNVMIPEETFQRLAERAAALNISVDELIQPALDDIAKYGPPPPDPSPPLTGNAWLAVREAMRKDAESRAGRYPPGFVLDDSRETMYREREDAQL